MSLYQYKIHTKLGQMLVISDEKKVYLLEFENSKNLERKLRNNFPVNIASRRTDIMCKLQYEMDRYFSGDLHNFTTDINVQGTNFQKRIWSALRDINFGEVVTYKNLAIRCGVPFGYRAVANANASNMIAIIIPCHRVIASDGSLGGYAGGIERKKKLLDLEGALGN